MYCYLKEQELALLLVRKYMAGAGIEKLERLAEHILSLEYDTVYPDGMGGYYLSLPDDMDMGDMVDCHRIPIREDTAS